ncbi:hypothetical protein PG994_001188 [Apiospora phragmitis]|uniref:Uncharacterized protein n=1 Tax=Apiospora phragmitis TaxID=2905665 RepID=A0ABR1WST8_9PEZI
MAAGFVSLSKTARFTCLESLVLAHFYTTSGALIEFLRIVAPTARQLRIHRVDLATLNRDLPVKQRSLPSEEIKGSLIPGMALHENHPWRKDLQFLYFNIETVPGGLRVTNPLRGRAGYNSHRSGRRTNFYDAAATNIGLGEWIDQLGFENSDDNALDDDFEFDFEEDSDDEWEEYFDGFDE